MKMDAKFALRTVVMVLGLSLPLASAAEKSNPVEETREALTKAGFQFGSWEDLPKIAGYRLSEPKYIRLSSFLLAQGFVEALKAVQGTTFGGKKQLILTDINAAILT